VEKEYLDMKMQRIVVAITLAAVTAPFVALALHEQRTENYTTFLWTPWPWFPLAMGIVAGLAVGLAYAYREDVLEFAIDIGAGTVSYTVVIILPIAVLVAMEWLLAPAGYSEILMLFTLPLCLIGMIVWQVSFIMTTNELLLCERQNWEYPSFSAVCWEMIRRYNALAILARFSNF
jgi:hypothetical protein